MSNLITKFILFLESELNKDVLASPLRNTNKLRGDILVDKLREGDPIETKNGDEVVFRMNEAQKKLREKTEEMKKN